MPGIFVKQTPAVKKDQQKHGSSPEPVDVILPVLLVMNLAYQFLNVDSTVWLIIAQPTLKLQMVDQEE
jgi:hypothetical protein